MFYRSRLKRLLLLQIQLYGFNKELYHNMSEAQHKSQGIVGISLMVQVSYFYFPMTYFRQGNICRYAFIFGDLSPFVGTYIKT